MWGWHDWSWGMWLAMSLWMTALLVGAVVLVWLLARTTQPTPVDRGEDRALEELRFAYPRGELSKEQFDERRRVLTGG